MRCASVAQPSAARRSQAVRGAGAFSEPVVLTEPDAEGFLRERAPALARDEGQVAGRRGSIDAASRSRNGAITTIPVFAELILNSTWRTWGRPSLEAPLAHPRSARSRTSSPNRPQDRAPKGLFPIAHSSPQTSSGSHHGSRPCRGRTSPAGMWHQAMGSSRSAFARTHQKIAMVGTGAKKQIRCLQRR